MALNSRKVETLKPGEKDYTVADQHGLGLRVWPSGKKSWVFKFRPNGETKQTKVTIGEYPAITLKQARAQVAEYRERIAQGGDPRLSAEEEALKKDGTVLFRDAAKAWYEYESGTRNAKYEHTIWRRLDTHVLPVLGDRPMNQITPKDVADCVEQIQNKGTWEVSKRCKWLVSIIFSYGMLQGWARYNPVPGIEKVMRRAPRAKPHNKLSPRDLPDFFSKLPKYQGRIVATAIEFTMHTFVRTAETRFARWEEFELAGDHPVWRIPAERMKMNREHLVPLTQRSLDLLKIAEELGDGSPWVFPGQNSQGVMSENAMLFALYKMGYRGKATIHGMRGLASTALNESGLFVSDWIERQLAHDEADAVRASYNSAQYLPQRRDMMTWWSEFLEKQRRIGEFLG
jgi:integrase